MQKDKANEVLNVVSKCLEEKGILQMFSERELCQLKLDIDNALSFQTSSEKPFRVEVYRKKDNKRNMYFTADRIIESEKMVSFLRGENHIIAFYPKEFYYHMIIAEEKAEISLNALTKRVIDVLMYAKSGSVKVGENIVIYGELKNSNKGSSSVVFSATNMETRQAIKDITCDFKQPKDVSESLAFICDRFRCRMLRLEM